MAHIVESDAQAWLEESKLTVGALDVALEEQVTTEVLGRLVTASYDVTGWTDALTTPKIVKKVIAMFYAGWFYDKMYSETADTNQYAQRLKREAEKLLQSILAGITDIEEVPGLTQHGDPIFFPSDASSALCRDEYEVGDGPAAFGMGGRF